MDAFPPDAHRVAHPSVLVHNEVLGTLILPSYSTERLRMLASLIEERGTFDFPVFDNGLFPAAAGGAGAAPTYRHVWVRDNVHVAHAHYLSGRFRPAAATIATLGRYFLKHRFRFDRIIARPADAADPMQRPHVRFDGGTLEELPQQWAHAQNDALGYFVWLFSLLFAGHHLQPGSDEIELLELFVEYFGAIRFWEDEDSGHWEEGRKVSASSIGVVTGALRELARAGVLKGRGQDDAVQDLINRGRAALDTILPAECVQPDPARSRHFDAALLFLIYPIAIVDGPMADAIVGNVIGTLQREIGICRYPGDSYWAADYREHFPTAEARTRDFSDDVAVRDALVRRGEEAQWCLFDPVLSAIYGERYLSRRDPDDLAKQTHYLNRSLGQITANFRCPEAYCLEHGRFIPNDHTPLLWTQANLWGALTHMADSVSIGVQ